MPKIQSRNKAINPLIELSSTALRLYNALGIFRDVYPSPEDPEWFPCTLADSAVTTVWALQERDRSGSRGTHES